MWLLDELKVSFFFYLFIFFNKFKKKNYNCCQIITYSTKWYYKAG